MFQRWAIIHLPTGKFLPQSSRKRQGYTHDEPVPMEDSNGCPRLFGREQDAKTALTWWLKGETTVTMSRYQSMDGVEYDEEWNTAPRADRKAEDFTVVKLEIKRHGF